MLMRQLRHAHVAGLETRNDEDRLEHALAAYRAIPDTELAVIPDASHGPLVEKPALCNQIIETCLTGEPTATLAPIRRRHRRDAPLTG